MYQFIHVETYAIKASTKTKPTKKKGPIKEKKPKATVGDVVGEALRDEGHCAHVDNPQKPVFLKGSEEALRALPLEIESNIEAHHKTHGGRKLRADAHVLLAGVVSFPRELQKKEPQTYDQWEKLTLEWLQKKYGNDLRVVLRHGDDEAHPHLHFYVVDRERVNAKELHDGYAASAGLDMLSKEAQKAYQDAMREVQTSYYEKVGHACGLLRDGPKNKRLERATYKAQQREARERVALTAATLEANATMLNETATEAKRVAEQRRQVERDLVALQQETEAIKNGLQRVAKASAGMDAEWVRIREKNSVLAARESGIEKREKEALHTMAQLKKDMTEVKEWQQAAESARNRAESLLRRANASDALRMVVERPALAGMVEFLHKNEDVRNVLAAMKIDSNFAKNVIDSRNVMDSINPLKNPDWDSSAAIDYLASIENTEQKDKVQDLDFSM